MKLINPLPLASASRRYGQLKQAVMNKNNYNLIIAKIIAVGFSQRMLNMQIGFSPN